MCVCLDSTREAGHFLLIQSGSIDMRQILCHLVKYPLQKVNIEKKAATTTTTHEPQATFQIALFM